MAALTLTAAAAPAAIAGIQAGANTNGANSAGWTFAGGSGGADTIANAELLKGVAAGSRLAQFLATSFATQADLDAAVAALGAIAFCNGATEFTFVTAAPGVPTATVTTFGATGAVRASISYSQSA